MISLQEIRMNCGFHEIVDFFVLDMCYKPIFCSKIALKGKTCLRLLKPQKVAPNAKSCSKVAEHNRDRPSIESRSFVYMLNSSGPIYSLEAHRCSQAKARTALSGFVPLVSCYLCNCETIGECDWRF